MTTVLANEFKRMDAIEAIEVPFNLTDLKRCIACTTDVSVAKAQQILAIASDRSDQEASAVVAASTAASIYSARAEHRADRAGNTATEARRAPSAAQWDTVLRTKGLTK